MSRDDGSIAPVVPVVILVLFMLGGLLVDGSRDLTARGRAQGYAEEASRAGANAVVLTTDPLTLDPVRVRTLVGDYCTKVTATDPEVVSCGLDTPDITDTSVCNGTPTPVVVHVVVQMRINTTLLGIVGVTHLDATGRASARPYQGVSPVDAC